jgi:hypothetical protein
MTVEEKIRQIMLSEELSGAEKLDRLHALIPPETFKVDNLNQATPAEFRKLKDGLAITDAMHQLRAGNCRQRIAASRAIERVVVERRVRRHMGRRRRRIH